MNKVCFDGLPPARTAPRRRAPALSCTRLVRPLLPRARNAHRRAAALCAQRQKTEAGPSSESSSEPAVFDAEDAAAKAKIEAMEAEEAKAEQARVAEDKKKASADQKAMKAMSKTDKVARLEQLLSKSIAYSEFLASKIKKEGEKGAKGMKGKKLGYVTQGHISQRKIFFGGLGPETTDASLLKAAVRYGKVQEAVVVRTDGGKSRGFGFVTYVSHKGANYVLKEAGDEALLNDWRKLTTSDHFYYMCTKYFADGDVHKYFNPYESPYDSYINFMNVLDHLRSRVGGKVRSEERVARSG